MSESGNGVPWKRVSGFVALPVLSAVAPVIVLPVLTQNIGAAGWASIAIGLSVGAMASTIVNFGWGMVGPSIVASVDELSARFIYRTSFVMRLMLCVPVLPLSFLLASLLDRSSDGVAAGVMAIAAALGGLSPAWYFVGRGRAAGIALWDTLPRLMAAFVSIPFVLFWQEPLIYPVVALVCSAAAWATFGVSLFAKDSAFNALSEHAVDAASYFPTQLSITISSGISSAYTGLTVALVSAVNYSAVATFAAGDRLRAMGKQGEVAVANGLQGWVSSDLADGVVTVAKMRRSITLMFGFGVLGSLAFAVGAPVFSDLFLGPEIAVEFDLAIAMAGTLLLTAVSMSLTLHVLAPLKRTRVVAVATTVGAVVGCPAVLVGAASGGALGAALGVLLAEAVVIAIELPWALRLLARLARDPGASP